ncbi:MAG: mevalonate kinase [Chloroflexota bacterium]
MTVATAPGKIILFGEHAVVYGRSAIAAPVSQLRATVVIENSKSRDVQLIAPQIQRKRVLSNAPDNDPFAMTVRLFVKAARIPFVTNLNITIQSDIPIAGGMGSGAAITAAMIRGLANHYNKTDLLDPAWLSELTYEVEKIHHGTPSGIDNTVVSYEQPLFFIKAAPKNVIEPFTVGKPLQFLIGITGIRSQTKLVVSDVRAQWEAAPQRFEAIFDACGEIAKKARQMIQVGDARQLGALMNKNQQLLMEMTVSSPELNRLTDTANQAGALGAKLSGAGRGGNMIALVTNESETAVKQALLKAGATAVYATTLA